MIIVVIINRIIRKIHKTLLKLFNSDVLKEYNVTRLYEETIYIKEGAESWINVYGFETREEGSEFRRWIGLDSRWLGIRVQDVLLEFKSVACYQKWKAKAHYDYNLIVNECMSTPEFSGMHGDDVNTEWIFKWGNESKNFDIHLSMDRYAIEK